MIYHLQQDNNNMREEAVQWQLCTAEQQFQLGEASYNLGFRKEDVRRSEESAKRHATEPRSRTQVFYTLRYNGWLSGKLPPGYTDPSMAFENQSHLWVLNCLQSA